MPESERALFILSKIWETIDSIDSIDARLGTVIRLLEGEVLDEEIELSEEISQLTNTEQLKLKTDEA